MNNDKLQSIDPRDAGNIASRHYSRWPTDSAHPWILKDPGHPINNVALIECITDITVAFRTMMDCASSSDPHEKERVWDISLSAIRQMSVPIRKLLLEKQGESIRQAISEPRMYPLGGEKGRYRKADLTWKTPPIHGYLSFEDGRQDEVNIPEREYRVQLGRLYGITYLGDACAVYSPFDHSIPPIALEKWLVLKVLQVNSVGYPIKDLLRLVATFKGAHNSSNFPTSIGGGFNAEQVNEGKEMKYKLANAVRFGGFTYPHLIVLFTGIQLIDQIQDLVKSYMRCSPNDSTPSNILALKRQVDTLQTNFFARLPVNHIFSEMIRYEKSGPVYGPGRSRISYRIWSGSHDWDA